MGLELTNT